MPQIFYLTHVTIESGALGHLPAECQRIGVSRPLIVTDAGIRAAGLLDKLMAVLQAGNLASVTVYDGTPANPTESAVREAAALVKQHGCDSLIAFGGGSSMDCAKGVAIVATHEGPMTLYATIEGGSPRISERVLPVIAIPTTAGTGSEVARGAILIVDDGRKLGFHSWNLVPKAALLDPDLTLGLPPMLTAATGMDAIAHCMETFMAPAFNPPADGIALDGLARAWSHIELATRNGADREARLQMMSASMEGAMSFQKGLGCVHSLSHATGAVDHTLHHGTLNAIYLPAVVRFNAQAESIVRERRMERMALAMGLPAQANAAAAADAIATAITRRNHELGLPSGLAALGLSDADFDHIVHGALADHSHKTNPRIASAGDYRQMLQDSLVLS
ncbi:MAG: iron-containing alcohol dehydrogenase [Betaproteobacteria bacterium]